MNILSIQPGDILREVSTARERVVVDFNSEMGLIAFEDSALVGWTPYEGWIPTGRRVESK